MFKVGDRVRRKSEYQQKNCPEWLWGDLVLTVDDVSKSSVCFSSQRGWWDACRFELAEEEVVVEKQVPGVPEGYRLVRIGCPKKGERFVNYNGSACAVTEDWESRNNMVIVEKIEPPKPKTVTVTINKYLVGDLEDPLSLYVMYATAERMQEMQTKPYRLIGVSETITLEVEGQV